MLRGTLLTPEDCFDLPGSSFRDLPQKLATPLCRRGGTGPSDLRTIMSDRPALWRNGTSFFENHQLFTSIWRVNGFFTSSSRYFGRLRPYIGRICTPFAYLAGLYVLLAPSKSAIFVDLGPKMAEYGRWRPETGVTRQPIAVPCSLVTMAAMYGHWLTHLRRICDIPSRRLLSAVLYGETPLGADRAEEVRLTAKRKP